ncbi:MAG: heparinase II/III family protein [Candidatus Latescibacter sp.]|nr:heparinase II/III family protein [Candidatus Latescibacter sp.]
MILGKKMLLAAAVVLGFCSHVFAGPVLTPFTYSEQFESGSVGAWSSYPPAQDTAYDPTIWVKPNGTGAKALFREITPNYEIDYLFGVRKLLDIYVNRSSVLTFKAYIKSNREIGGVLVRLGFADGAMVERTVPFTSKLVWNDCSLNLAEIITGEEPKKLRAVAFMAVCPSADPENLLRFGLDDVKLNGFREENWEFSSPQVHKLAEWTDFIAASHYRAGETLTISGKTAFQPRAIAVRVNRAFTGDRGGIFIMKPSGDNRWSVDIPLSEKSGLGPGFWRATILTSSKEGETLSTGMVFLVKSPGAPDRNPRLLMGPGDAPKILAKASSGRMKSIWESIQNQASGARARNTMENFKYNLEAYDEIYWLPTYGGYISAIRTPAAYIRSNAVVYGLSGDKEAGDAAARALVQMAKWPSFVHPHILNQGQFTYWPVGQILSDLAIGYDMVSDRFTPEERKIVAQALFSKGVTEVFKEYVRDNRVSSFTSNWIGDVTGGGILCALAIMNEFKDEDLEPYLTGMLLKMGRLIDTGFDRDGDYGEGYSYLNHALENINQAAPALERTFGVAFSEKLANCFRFLPYQIDPRTRQLYDFGDTSERLAGMSNFAYIQAKYHDPLLAWLYNMAPGTRDVDLFLADSIVQAKGPDELPKTVLFRDTGTAIFRSGFSHEDFSFVFRCGPFYNHQHFDQGGFFLSDKGENFLVEAGRTDYYSDPWYQKLFIQAGGHNCILIDDNPESQRAGDFLKDVPAWKNHAAITDFLVFEGGACASGKLDPLYKGKIGNLRRTVLFLAPQTIVLLDEADSPRDARTIDLRFHAPRKEDIVVEGRDAYVKRPGGTLSIHTVLPSQYRAEVRKRPLSISEFGSENAITMKARGYLQLSADLGKSPLLFVNIMTTDPAGISGLNEKISSESVTFTCQGNTWFVNTAEGKKYSAAGAVTDALVYSAVTEGFRAVRVTSVSRNGAAVFSSDKPVSIDFHDGTAKSLQYSAFDKTQVALQAASKPLSVTLNGSKFDAWKWDRKNGLTVTLEAGEGVLVIK